MIVIALETLNQDSADGFTVALAGIFEHSPWIPQRVAQQRPFRSRQQLLQAMRAVVQNASAEEQLALIRAHPRLGARGRARTRLTSASSSEQRGAGLDACSDEQFARLLRLNDDYEAKFGFPFILAVRGHDPVSVLAQMHGRLTHGRDDEISTALNEIGLIAGYRLEEVVAEL